MVTSSPFVAIQLYPYDVADEGAEAVVANAQMAAATTLIPAVAYVRESQPLPSGELPHNPVRKRYDTDGGVYFRVDESLYPRSLVPPMSAEHLDYASSLRDLSNCADSRGMEVVPWISLLSGHAAHEAQSYNTLNAAGERVEEWLCPTRPETLEFVRALVRNVILEFSPRTIFLDRIRFPEWGSRGLIDACTCFCDACVDLADARGIRTEQVRALLVDFVEQFRTQASSLVGRIVDGAFSPLRWTALLGAHSDWLRWQEFRCEQIARVVAVGHDEARNAGVEVWLDVWPPSYGWLLGQDLRRFSTLGSLVKPFTYHRLAGGADIAGFIHSLGGGQDDSDAVYRAYKAFFGFPAPGTLREFISRGLNPEFVTSETLYAKQLVADRQRVAAGLQIWQVGVAGVREVIEQAALARPDAYFLFSYGWASLDELDAAGDALRRLFDL